MKVLTKIAASKWKEKYEKLSPKSRVRLQRAASANKLRDTGDRIGKNFKERARKALEKKPGSSAMKDKAKAGLMKHFKKTQGSF